MCRCACPKEILIHFFFSRSYAHFEFRNLAIMEDSTETVCQRNSSETARQNFLNLCSCKVHTCRCAYPQEVLIPYFFLGITPFLNLEIWPKWNSLSAQFLWNRSTEFRETVGSYEGHNVHRKFWCKFFKHLMEEGYNSCFCIFNEKSLASF